ncbi:glycosyltransferase family 2 protein [Frondihabitans peucedani]|uniref:Glycosyltransferase 2-like domain-containing protein n=1 Tax=Frondihabitans peucedani TaxID=598626 RepID=A0ABP8DZI7_9MICO
MTTPAAPRPLISVVIPAHDVEPWIDELLESVLAQGGDELQVIVVDDHSSDGTPARVAEFARRDRRILHHVADTRGAAAARNAGTALATGTYLVFADADDLVPRGAYAALADSLERTGSDFAIGDHLKFSPTSTWSPTARWHPFEEAVERARPGDLPALVSGRAAWNRMFRRSFWDSLDLRFPEVARNDDIVPTTRAFLGATAIDVVPECVYLYRDRPGSTSMTAGTPPAEAARLYFEQELLATRLVTAFDDPAVTEQYSALVFDADGWVHLSGYLGSLESGESADPEVLAAFAALLAEAPRVAVERATADRRALIALAEAGRIEEARSLAVAAASARVARSFDAAGLVAWARAFEALDADGGGLDLVALLREGPLTALANDAALVSADELGPVVAALAGAPSVATADTEAWESAILRWMLAAVRSGDPAAVRRVSLVRRGLPLVVDTVDVSPASLELSGPLPWPEALDGAVLLLRSEAGTAEPSLSASPTGDRWRASVAAAELPAPGRYSALVRFSAGPSVQPQDHEVVTARMPLPPIPDGSLLQPLSDRARGWVFLVDHRAPAARGLLGKVASRLRRG